jgi:hypothetical protein
MTIGERPDKSPSSLVNTNEPEFPADEPRYSVGDPEVPPNVTVPTTDPPL